MDKIVLTEEKETLLIPLFGKARENEKKTPILVDKKAAHIIKQIHYDFSTLNIPEKTNIMMCLRAKLIDNFTGDFLAQNPQSIALHLGCGLDSRYDRIGNTDVDWYDVDFPEVIEIRKHFYQETDHYHLLSTSVTAEGWLEEVPQENKPCIVVAEGLFMYLNEAEIKTLITHLKERMGSFTLVFDAFSVYTAKKVNNHPSIKKTGAVVSWGLDDPEDLVKWGLGIQVTAEQYFTANEEIENLTLGMRLMFKIANLFPFVKKAQRLIICRVG